MLKFSLAWMVFCLAATPVSAAWFLDRDMDEGGEFFVAYSRDGSGIMQVQVLCDPAASSSLMLSVYTGEKTEQMGAAAAGAPLAIKVGDQQFPVMPTTIFVIDGERVLNIAESDVPQVRDVILALAGGGNVISFVEMEDEIWLIPGYGSGQVFQRMSDECADFPN